MKVLIQRSNKVSDIMYKTVSYRGTFDMNFSLLEVARAGLKGFQREKTKTNHSSGQLNTSAPEGRGKDWRSAMPFKICDDFWSRKLNQITKQG